MSCAQPCSPPSIAEVLAERFGPKPTLGQARYEQYGRRSRALEDERPDPHAPVEHEDRPFTRAVQASRRGRYGA